MHAAPLAAPLSAASTHACSAPARALRPPALRPPALRPRKTLWTSSPRTPRRPSRRRTCRCALGCRSRGSVRGRCSRWATRAPHSRRRSRRRSRARRRTCPPRCRCHARNSRAGTRADGTLHAALCQDSGTRPHRGRGPLTGRRSRPTARMHGACSQRRPNRRCTCTSGPHHTARAPSTLTGTRALRSRRRQSRDRMHTTVHA